MFYLRKNQVDGFYHQNMWKTPAEEWNLSKDAVGRPASLLKRCFSHILLVKTNYLVSP